MKVYIIAEADYGHKLSAITANSNMHKRNKDSYRFVITIAAKMNEEKQTCVQC